MENWSDAVLDTNVLDIRQWASEWNKSLAQKDKPLVQKKMYQGV